MVETNEIEQRITDAKEEVIAKLEAVSAEQDCEQKKKKLPMTVQTAADPKTSVLGAESVATRIDADCSAVASDGENEDIPLSSLTVKRSCLPIVEAMECPCIFGWLNGIKSRQRDRIICMSN